MKKISAEMIMYWGPCEAYPPERVSELVPHAMAPLEILSLRIPAADRLWVVLRGVVLPDRILRLFAASCAERALDAECRAGREPDPRSWDACRVARLHADGQASDEELTAALAAALAASGSAALAAAWTATSTAALAAASVATLVTDWAAVSAADWAAARAAERGWQVDSLRALIKEVSS